MAVIYEPRGRAREYAPLAANLYSGCEHGCLYCYVPLVLKRHRDEFHSKAKPRYEILNQLEKDCRKQEENQGNGCHVLLSFTSDPYQPIEETCKLTRKAIKILHECNYGVQILTKGGMRAARDFELLSSKDAFATTMTFLTENLSRAWEPKAAFPDDRIKAIKKAKKFGIPTWVSLEPVINPDEAMKIIKKTHEFVDLFKIGPLNYRQEAKKIDWRKFGHEVIEYLEKLGKAYYIKDDLKKHL